MRHALALACLLLLGLPAAASAHATLVSSEPARGVTVREQPDEVVLRFSEPVEAAFGALRVVGADGKRVDDGKSGHPAGQPDALRVGLKDGIADGTYVATYRVISADSHPVSGGVVFNVGRPGEAPADVTKLVNAEAGPVSKTALKVVRGVAYLATAILAGGLIFLVAAWAPALGATGAPAAAAAAMDHRVRPILVGAAAVGAAATGLGLGLQAALASGASLWQAVDADTFRELLKTNFGHAWAIRLVAFTGLGVLAAVARPLGRRPIELGLGALGVLALCVTPALAGHARATDPVWLNVTLDALHVAAMSAWVGGLVLLLAAVPAATRALAARERTRLLAAVLQRFSPLAMLSVAVLVLTGIVASIEHLTAVSDLWDSSWGRLVLAKIVLLLVLIALGAINQRRTMPRLRRLAEEGAPPGDDGRVLRATLRAEVALVVGALAVTGVLVGISPPASAAGGPASLEREVGPLDLQATLDPAQAGVNELHLYLLRRDGTPFTGTKELRVTAALPAEQIGPLPAKPRRAGPGHYVIEALPLTPGGDWELAFSVRVSEFDQYDTRWTVAVR